MSTERLWRRGVMMAVVIGGALGALGGVAYAGTAYFQHTAGLWNHGIDGHHYYATRTDRGTSDFRLAAIHFDTCFGQVLHTGDNGYVGNHVHANADDAFCASFVAAHFSSPGPYLGHHEHP